MSALLTHPEISPQNRTGWQGSQDSNSNMPFRKMPFEMSHEFPTDGPISAIRDYSRASCKKPGSRVAGAVVDWMKIMPGGRATGNRKRYARQNHQIARCAEFLALA